MARIKYPMMVFGSGIGKWFKLPNDLTLKPKSGRFVGKDGSGNYILTNGAAGGNIVGWLDMPNDARVYQMENLYESVINPDYTYKAGDYVFLMTDLETAGFRVPLVGGNLADLKVGDAVALVVNSDGIQGIDTTYAGTEKHVKVLEVNSEEDIIVQLL